MTTTTREQRNDKPLGDDGSGASGGGSGGNLPDGAAPATGGDPHQGTRIPDAPRPVSGEAEGGAPEERDLKRQPEQTAEVPLGSGNKPEPSGGAGFGSHSTEGGESQGANASPPATVDKDIGPVPGPRSALCST
jgi:hypothetical protein